MSTATYPDLRGNRSHHRFIESARRGNGAPFRGGLGNPIPVLDITEDQWRNTMNADLTSKFLTVKTFVPPMKEKRSGNIILMSSAAGRLVSLASAAYGAAEAGTLIFIDTRSGLWANAYYQYPIANPPSPDLEGVLRFGMENKVKQRQEREGLNDYKIRLDSVQRAVVDGRPALSWVADFSARGPRHQPMTEYMLRYIGANGKADIFTQMPASLDLGAFVNRMMPIIQSLRIP